MTARDPSGRASHGVFLIDRSSVGTISQLAPVIVSACAATHRIEPLALPQSLIKSDSSRLIPMKCHLMNRDCEPVGTVRSCGTTSNQRSEITFAPSKHALRSNLKDAGTATRAERPNDF